MGDEEWRENPRHAVAQHWHDLLRLWASCRGDMGIAHWPDPGGVAHQAAWIVDAFAALARAAEQLREAERNRGGP